MKILLLIIIFYGILLVGFYVSAADDVMTIPDPLEGKTIQEIISSIMDLLAVIGIGVATIMIIWGGIQYMTAGANEQQVTSAKKTIIWAIIGLAIVWSAKFIVDLVEYILKQ